MEIISTEGGDPVADYLDQEYETYYCVAYIIVWLDLNVRGNEGETHVGD
jgi:hypothetical protein